MRVRPAREDDAAAIAAVYAPVVEAGVSSFEAVAPDAAEVRRRMAARPLLPWLVAEEDGVVGYAYASRHRDRAAYRWAADCSIYLASDARGRGVGTALYDALIPLLRDLGYVTVHAGITLPNAASVALHERSGFAPVGVYRAVGFKHGAWHDVGWWQLRLRDLPDDPEPPREWVS